MTDQVCIGSLTLHIEGPGLPLRLNDKDMYSVACSVLDQINAELGVKVGIQFEYTVISLESGCVKAKIKLFLKIAGLIAAFGGGGAAFVIKYPDFREGLIAMVSDIGKYYECRLNDDVIPCFISLYTEDISPRSHTVQEGETLTEIVQGWGINGFSVYQLSKATFNVNPGAFIDNNMDMLKAGSVLMSPTKKDLKGIPKYPNT